MSPPTEEHRLSFEAMQAFIDQECADHLPLSFVQGHMLAWFVLNRDGDVAAWRASFFDIFPQLRTVLVGSEFLSLFWQKTRNELYADNYVLKLALPEDDEPMEQRLVHLSSWAKGFMQPFGDLESSGRQWSEIAVELLTSVTALIEVDPESIAEMTEDEAELHYMEITEFTKLAPYLMMTAEAQQNQPDG